MGELGEQYEVNPLRTVPPLDGDKSITRVIRKSVGHENQDFWALKWQRAKLIYIKLPICLFFIWRLDLMIFTGANPLLVPSNGLHHIQYVPRHINKRYEVCWETNAQGNIT